MRKKDMSSKKIDLSQLIQDPKKRKIIIISAIIILLLIIGILIINKTAKNNKLKQISKAQEEYGYDKPYVPEGFTHIEGEWNTGYVIKDINLGNEFVWIPIDGQKVANLQRRNWSVTDISIEKCNEQLEETFKTSVERYGGYYVGRYEAGTPEGKEFSSEDEMNINGKPVTKKGSTIWNNINYQNARNKRPANVWDKPRNNK